MKLFSNIATKVLLVLSCLVLLFFYNLNTRPLKTVEQANFEIWLNSLNQTDSFSFSDIEVNLTFPATDTRAAKILAVQAETPADQNKILRILTLAREARLFQFQNNASNSNDFVLFQVKSGEQEFKSRFLLPEIKNNVQAQTLLMLLRVFSEESKEKPAIEILTAKKKEGYDQ